MSGGSRNQEEDAASLVPAERMVRIARRWFQHFNRWTLLEIASLAIVASVGFVVVGDVIGAMASDISGGWTTAEYATAPWANPLVAMVLLAASLASWYEVTRSGALVEGAGNAVDGSDDEAAEAIIRVRRSRRLGTASLVLSLATAFGALTLLVTNLTPPYSFEPIEYLSSVGSFAGTLVVAAASAVTVARLRARSGVVVT